MLAVLVRRLPARMNQSDGLPASYLPVAMTTTNGAQSSVSPSYNDYKKKRAVFIYKFVAFWLSFDSKLRKFVSP